MHRRTLLRAALAVGAALPAAAQTGQDVPGQDVPGQAPPAWAPSRAAPDGHTLLFGHVGVLAVNSHLHERLHDDPRRDVRPVGLVVSNRSGITALDGFQERARRGELMAGTSGTTPHLGVSQAFVAAGGQGGLIRYRGEVPALNDLLAGTVGMIMSQGSNAIPPAQAGRARALAVTGPSRLPELPGVPTAAEAGMPGLDLQVWNAIVLPRAVPDAAAAAHSAALSAALDGPGVQARFAQVSARAPAHLAALIDNEGRRRGELPRAAGVEKER